MQIFRHLWAGFRICCSVPQKWGDVPVPVEIEIPLMQPRYFTASVPVKPTLDRGGPLGKGARAKTRVATARAPDMIARRRQELRQMVRSFMNGGK